MVVGSTAYLYKMFLLVNTFVKITPKCFTDSLGAIEDAPIRSACAFSDLIQCGEAKYIIFWCIII